MMDPLKTHNLLKLCDVTGADFNEIINGPGKQHHYKSNESTDYMGVKELHLSGLTDDEAQLIESYRCLDRERKDIIQHLSAALC